MLEHILPLRNFVHYSKIVSLNVHPPKYTAMYPSLLILYLLVKCYMCRDKLHGCRLDGVSICQSRTSVGQLIQICFIKLVHGQRLPPNVQPRTKWDGVTILVGEGLANMESGFLEKQSQEYID